MELLEAQRLAEELLRLHKLSPKWTFRFDRSKVAFGKCYYGKREITLSRYLVELNNEPEVRDTILHEIAHALAPRGAGHNSAWQAIARSIGCNGERCYGADVTRPRAEVQRSLPWLQIGDLSSSANRGGLRELQPGV